MQNAGLRPVGPRKCVHLTETFRKRPSGGGDGPTKQGKISGVIGPGQELGKPGEVGGFVLEDVRAVNTLPAQDSRHPRVALKGRHGFYQLRQFLRRRETVLLCPFDDATRNVDYRQVDQTADQVLSRQSPHQAAERDARIRRPIALAPARRVHRLGGEQPGCVAHARQALHLLGGIEGELREDHQPVVFSGPMKKIEHLPAPLDRPAQGLQLLMSGLLPICDEPGVVSAAQGSELLDRLFVKFRRFNAYRGFGLCRNTPLAVGAPELIPVERFPGSADRLQLATYPLRSTQQNDSSQDEEQSDEKPHAQRDALQPAPLARRAFPRASLCVAHHLSLRPVSAMTTPRGLAEASRTPPASRPRRRACFP